MKKCNTDQCTCSCDNNNTQLCECKFLKPLCIDTLFTCNNDNKICDVLDKAKKIRNSLFTVKTLIKNYIDECAVLLDELSDSVVTNEMLNNMKHRYINSINNLTLAIYSAIKVTYNDRAVLNSTYSKYINKEYKKVPNCSLLKLKKYEHQDSIVIIAQLPGILIQYSEKTKEIEMKFRDCENINFDRCYMDHNKDKDTIKTFKIGPSILTNVDLSNVDLSENQYNMNVFDNSDLAYDFMEEIVNYNELNNNTDSFGNEILNLMTYLDDLIIKIENVHKYVVQICKIENF